MQQLRILGCGLIVLVALALLPGRAIAQSSSPALSGAVTDPTGAVIPGAAVSVKGANSQLITAKTDAAGEYRIQTLQPGKYTVSIAAKGFSVVVREVEIGPGEAKKADFALEISAEKAEVVVEAEAATVSTNPDSNGAAIVLSGKDLEALSDDPDELQSELQALAGPAAGPNGGQIYIDGFTGGQLPPKSSIREIRINQNPFSAEYDKIGFGRIEIFTKPGTDKFHGQIFFNDNNKVLNTNNPFVANQPGYHSEIINGNVGGPLSKHSSFFINAERRNINDTSSVVATTVGSNFAPLSVTEAIANPRTRTNVSARLDFQLGANNTLTTRYSWVNNNEVNAGIGSLNLPSQAYNTSTSENSFQLTDTQVINPKTVNETRFEFQRTNTGLFSQSNLPTIVVPGAFTSGGNPNGTQITIGNHVEVQNYTSMAMGNHLFKFGGRLRVTDESLLSTQNFNGIITYPTFQAYVNALQTPPTPGTATAANSPNKIVVATGQPRITDTLADAGVYVQDDWKLRPNLTLSGGLRFETQNDISDHADFAPRLGLAWGVDQKGKKAAKTIIRAGWGIFYERFSQNLVLEADQINDVNQSQFQFNQSPAQSASSVVFDPNNPGVLPALGRIESPLNSAIYRIDPNLRAPYSMQGAIGVERQLSKIATLTVNYINSRGLHQLVTDNVNAPNPFANGLVAFPNQGPIYQFESVGIFKQEQLMTNLNLRAGQKLTLFGFFVVNNAHGDTSQGGGGGAAFPSNPFDIAADFGRTSFDIRYRTFIGGNIALPFGFRASPFVIFNSGTPFNITIGQDRNGSTILNQRPFFAASPNQQGAIATPFGVFDPGLTPAIAGEQIIPSYLGTGPNEFVFNLRLAKTFGFGKPRESSSVNPQNRGGGNREGGGGGGGPRGGGVFGGGPGGGPGGVFGGPANTNHPYNLTFSIFARNLFNNANLAPPVGVVESPRFDQSIATAGLPFASANADRRVDLQVMFSF